MPTPANSSGSRTSRPDSGQAPSRPQERELEIADRDADGSVDDRGSPPRGSTAEGRRGLIDDRASPGQRRQGGFDRLGGEPQGRRRDAASAARTPALVVARPSVTISSVSVR
jgi:hypothetical protein